MVRNCIVSKGPQVSISGEWSVMFFTRVYNAIYIYIYVGIYIYIYMYSISYGYLLSICDPQDALPPFIGRKRSRSLGSNGSLGIPPGGSRARSFLVSWVHISRHKSQQQQQQQQQQQHDLGLLMIWGYPYFAGYGLCLYRFGTLMHSQIKHQQQ